MASFGDGRGLSGGGTGGIAGSTAKLRVDGSNRDRVQGDNTVSDNS